MASNKQKASPATFYRDAINQHSQPFITTVPGSWIIGAPFSMPKTRFTSSITLADDQVILLRDAILNRTSADAAQPVQVRVACFRASSGGPKIEWPHSFTFSINHRPLVIKQNIVSFDITAMCVVGQNRIDGSVTSQHNYTLVFFLAREFSTANLAADCQAKNLLSFTIGLDRVRKAFTVGASEDDVIETEKRISLVDPLSRVRIRVPARGRLCKHLTCFDLETYLQLNARHPKWKCPVCSVAVPVSELFVDAYTIHLLQVTEDAKEAVVQPSGEAKMPSSDDVLQRESKRRRSTVQIDLTEDSDGENAAPVQPPPDYNPTTDYSARLREQLARQKALQSAETALYKDIDALHTQVWDLGKVIKSETINTNSSAAHTAVAAPVQYHDIAAIPASPAMPAIPAMTALPVICPVCNVALPLAIADAEITAHIDDCLVRQQLMAMGPGWF